MGDRGHLGQKVDQVPAQLIRRNRVILGQMGAHVVQCELLCCPGQPKDDIGQHAVAVRIGHFGMTTRRLIDNVGWEVICRTGPGQNVNIKSGKVDQIKSHALRPIGSGPFQVCPGPVQHRHEVVTNHFDPGICQMVQAGFPVGYMPPPIALLLFDRFRDRQAFDHLPAQTGCTAAFLLSNQRLPPGNVSGRPDGPGRHVMQGRHHPLHPRLQHIVDRSCIIWPKPPPSLPHCWYPCPNTQANLAAFGPDGKPLSPAKPQQWDCRGVSTPRSQ